MSAITGNLVITSSDASSPKVIGLTANQQFPNVEQSCDEGYTGDPIPAGTYYADTQEAANALAAADLVCVPDVGDFVEGFEGPGFEQDAITSGVINDTYTTGPAPLHGSYSATGTAGSDITYAIDTFGAKSVYAIIGALWDISGYTNNSALNFGFTLTDAGLTHSVGIVSVHYYDFDEDIDEARVVSSVGGAISDTAFVTPGQTQHIWIDYNSTTGVVEFYISSSATKPGSPTYQETYDSGVSWANLVIEFSDANAPAAGIVDRIILSQTTIGSNP
jgi:hypothetical protein